MSVDVVGGDQRDATGRRKGEEGVETAAVITEVEDRGGQIGPARKALPQLGEFVGEGGIGLCRRQHKDGLSSPVIENIGHV